MKKYIDAEKLKELIDEKWKELADKNIKVGGGKWDAEIITYLSVLNLIDSLKLEQLVNKDLGTLIACDIIEMTAKKAIDKPQDKEKEEELMTRKINYLRSLEENYVQPEQPKTDMKSPFTGGNVAILSREEEVIFRGEKIKITRKYYRCVDTGREFTDSKFDEDMMWAIFRAYCEKKGITSFTDIMLKQEQSMPDSTKLIEFWNEDKEMLKEKDFHNDAWRLAYNAFMCGFGRGISVKKQEQPLTTEKVVEQCKKFGGNPEVIQPEVDLEKEIDKE